MQGGWLNARQRYVRIIDQCRLDRLSRQTISERNTQTPGGQDLTFHSIQAGNVIDVSMLR